MISNTTLKKVFAASEGFQKGGSESGLVLLLLGVLLGGVGLGVLLAGVPCKNLNPLKIGAKSTRSLPDAEVAGASAVVFGVVVLGVVVLFKGSVAFVLFVRLRFPLLLILLHFL